MLSVSKSVLLCVLVAILMVFLYRSPFSFSENETEILLFNSEQDEFYTVQKGNDEEKINWVIQKRIVRKQSVSSMKNKKLYNFKARLNAISRVKKEPLDVRYSYPSHMFPKRTFEDSPYALKDFGFYDTNRKILIVVSFVEYDYPDIQYPIPFKQLVHNQTMRYVHFGETIPEFPEFVKTGPVEDSSFQYSDCVIVTGCSSNHLLSTLNMMYSAVIADVYAPIVLVDYGIDSSYYPEMIETFRTIHRIYQSVNSSASIYYRKLNFDHFPSWWNISDPAIRGGYSWKVVSIYDVLMESRRIVVWSDGGNLFSYDFVDELKRVYQYGAYSPYSGDNLGKWVHHTSSHFLSVNKMVRKIMLGKGMCNGAFMLFDYNHDEVMNTVVIPYTQCAYTRKCISPLGTSRKNHRQDQAVVSVLMHSARIKESCHGGFRSSIRIHNDCKNPTWCQDIREPLLRNIESLYPVSVHLQKLF